MFDVDNIWHDTVTHHKYNVKLNGPGLRVNDDLACSNEIRI